MVYDGSLLYQFAIRDFESYCSSYADPSHYILGQLNEIMFRTGVYVANPYNSSLLSTSSSVQRYLDPGMAVNTTVTGELIGNQSVYRTNFWYFLAAALVELTCIALISPTYWGWWRLGRSVSFSPLEIAKVRTYYFLVTDVSIDLTPIRHLKLPCSPIATPTVPDTRLRRRSVTSLFATEQRAV